MGIHWNCWITWQFYGPHCGVGPFASNRRLTPVPAAFVWFANGTFTPVHRTNIWNYLIKRAPTFVAYGGFYIYWFEIMLFRDRSEDTWINYKAKQPHIKWQKYKFELTGSDLQKYEKSANCTTRRTFPKIENFGNTTYAYFASSKMNKVARKSHTLHTAYTIINLIVHTEYTMITLTMRKAYTMTTLWMQRTHDACHYAYDVHYDKSDYAYGVIYNKSDAIRTVYTMTNLTLCLRRTLW
jgi:hypothetical protein